MPGQGLVPARGDWEYKWFECDSTTTFAKGSLVNFTPAYALREYNSLDSQFVGIALSASTQSTSMRGLNMVEVALPAPNCTAYSDLTTGVAQSGLSIGKKILIYKQGNLMSYASTLFGQASGFSQIAQVYGPIDALTSRVEISFNILAGTFYSGSTSTFAV